MYFSINNVDFSTYVKSLKINTSTNFISQTNALGDTVVDRLGTKRQIEVGIITLDSWDAYDLLETLTAFQVSLSFLNPYTNELEEGVVCIIPSTDISYYTIQADKVLVNEFNLVFTEL